MFCTAYPEGASQTIDFAEVESDQSSKKYLISMYFGERFLKMCCNIAFMLFCNWESVYSLSSVLINIVLLVMPYPFLYGQVQV